MRFGPLLLITWTIFVRLVEVVSLTWIPILQVWSDWDFVWLIVMLMPCSFYHIIHLALLVVSDTHRWMNTFRMGQKA